MGTVHQVTQFLRHMVPEDAPSWKDIGLGAFASGLITILGFVVKSLLRGNASRDSAALKAASEANDRLLEELKLTREQAERFHRERLDADDRRHVERSKADDKREAAHATMLAAVHVRLDGVDAKLHHINNVLSKLAITIAGEKANDRKGQLELLNWCQQKMREALSLTGVDLTKPPGQVDVSSS